MARIMQKKWPNIFFFRRFWVKGLRRSEKKNSQKKVYLYRSTRRLSKLHIGLATELLMSGGQNPPQRYTILDISNHFSQ